MKLLKLAVGMLAVVALAGCNAQSTAQKAQAVITATLNIAQAEEPLVPVADQAVYLSFVGLGQTLNTQLGTCISNISGLTGTNAKFQSCFNTFVQGLLAPGELAQLRILNPTTAAKVQLYITGVVAGVNILEAFLQAPPVVAPVVGPAPSPAALHAFTGEVREAAGL